MSEFGFYSGVDFISKEFPKKDWLIEGFIRERDAIILVGTPKVGKSVLTLQIICSLTTQHPLFDKFNILRACNVTYLQLEGDIADTQDRAKRMMKSVEFDATKFSIGYLPPLKLNEIKEAKGLIIDIEMIHKPDVIIIDCAYFAFRGKMSDDDVVREFLGNLRIIKDHFNCTLILIHHTHKIRKDQKGNVILEGDEAMFGSQFFAAWPDHILFFVFDEKTGTRILQCNTQRSGTIEPATKLRMVQPDPLYFQDVTNIDVFDSKLFQEMESCKQMLDAQSWCNKTGIAKRTFYVTIKKLMLEGIITKDETKRPVKYGVSV